MKRNIIPSMLAVAALAGAAACSDSTSPGSASLTTDQQVTADVAQSAGDALVLDIQSMAGNELSVGLPLAAPAGFQLFGASDPGMPASLSITRSRTCYDQSNAVITCTPLSAVYSINFQLSLSGSFARYFDRGNGVTDTMQASINRSRNWTLSGLQNTDSTRQHDGVGTAADTTYFSNARRSRSAKELAIDSAVAIIVKLPRATHPWPISGSWIRNVNAIVVVTANGTTNTRTVQRRVVVTFPADNQGNVALDINGQACTLNLVTHKVVC
jgi:hypothetical protein